MPDHSSVPPSPFGDKSKERFASITRRYPGPAVSVTRIYPGEGVTARYLPDASTPSTPPTPLSDRAFGGMLVAERYRVLDGPLGGASGEAEVFRCYDEHTATEVAVKLYHYQARPKEEVIRQLQGVHHPHVLCLLTVGQWNGRFYEVAEYCAGGTLADVMPLSEEELRGYLVGVVEGLEYCHRQGIVHRDIKPTNLFFRDTGRRELLIGDFGISSYLDLGDAVRVTTSADRLTLDFAAPELLDRHEVGPKGDYYSLGITLLYAFFGRSPFHGRSPNDILVAHLRGRLTLPEGLSPTLTHLARGLITPDPALRWGYDEVQAWLRGEEPLLAPTVLEIGVGRPYPGWPAAHTPRELAAAFELFDASHHFARGDIRRWVFDGGDASLADRIERLEQEYAARPERALGRLRYLLDPEAPLVLCPLASRGGATPTAWQVHNLRELATLLEQDDQQDLQDALERNFFDGLLEIWVEAGREAGERTPELLQQLHALRRRLGRGTRRGLTAFALLRTLDPGRGLEVGGIRIDRSGGLCTLVSRLGVKDACTAFADPLYDGRYEEWLRAASPPNWKKELNLVQDLRYRYGSAREIGTRYLFWSHCPALPFRFHDVVVIEPAALARLIDHSPEDTRRGRNLLEEGWIRAWLVGSGRLSNPAPLDQVLLAPDQPWEAKLEEILHLLDPSLPVPRPVVEPSGVSFGVISPGAVRTRSFTLRNTGRGYLYGTVWLADLGVGLTLDRHTFYGNFVELVLTLDLLDANTGSHRTIITLDTNGGLLTIPVTWFIRPEEEDWTQWLQIQRLKKLITNAHDDES
ncbi:Non-specific serine/threonine protein kinase [Gammaproteobacteria bacterium]